MITDRVVTQVASEHPEVVSLSVASHWIVFGDSFVVVGAFSFAIDGVMVEGYPVCEVPLIPLPSGVPS